MSRFADRLTNQHVKQPLLTAWPGLAEGAWLRDSDELRSLKNIRFGLYILFLELRHGRTPDPNGRLTTWQLTSSPVKQIKKFQCVLRLTYVFALKFYPSWRARMHGGVGCCSSGASLFWIHTILRSLFFFLFPFTRLTP
jgi:hypothetical protein